MSVVLSLTSAAIVAGLSISSLSAAQFLQSREDGAQPVPCLETVFSDAQLLKKTLTDFGCCVAESGENEYRVETSCGTLRYFRGDPTQPFRLELSEVEDPGALLEQIRLFEEEYGRNVQTYTYHHIMEHLSADMQVVSQQVLEDDSLVLTISI